MLGLAAEAQAGPREDADAALHRGVVLRREGNDAEALEAFQQALALAPSARARAQVALAEQALALWLAAERDLALALAEKDDPWIRQNREALEGAARVVASKLGWATVTTNVPQLAEVLVNGSPVPAGDDGRRRVIAGLVTIEARAEGYVSATQTLRIGPETTANVTLDLQPVAREPSAGSPATRAGGEAGVLSAGSTQRTAGFIVTGVGVVGLGVGAFFGLQAVSKKDDRDAACAGGCTQEGVDADRDGRAAGLVSTLAVIGGAAATGVGLWLILSARREPASTRASVRLHTTGSWAGLGGSF